ncbi:MAG: hypothetical protein Q9160_003715 [Pyrenula sp. 1 TL-2023]
MPSWQYSQVPLSSPPPYQNSPPIYQSPYGSPSILTPTVWQHYQAVPPTPTYGSYFNTQPTPLHTPPFEQKLVGFSTRKQRRRWLDYPTLLLLLAVWAFLTLSCVILLFFTAYFSTATSVAGKDITGKEIASTLALSSVPILLATILNEVLVDRCWRRVACAALGRNAVIKSNSRLAINLRAANFEWLNFLKRAGKCDLSFQDIRAVFSYGLLRWGSAVSIASVQLCVTWQFSVNPRADDKVGLYTAHKRLYWVVVPVFLHSLSVFGTMLIWFIPPWLAFSNRFDDHGLLNRYEPYLQRIRGGSVVKSETVAQHLASNQTDIPLGKEHQPGIQSFAKLKGIWFGLGSMCLPPAAAWAYTRYVHYDNGLGFGTYRFAFHLVFLAQNIFYLLALDFVVWNLSLEGFCRTKSLKQQPNKSLRHLGYSSGIVLLMKSFKQRRPIRSAVFLWLFWLQACLVRFVTVLYTLCLTVLSYGSKNDQKDFYDPYFWLGWILMTGFFVFPLFGVWLFTRFQAPICEQDGWRWAKIARTAMWEDGFYGVRNGEAVWARDVTPFDERKGEKLY